MKTYEAQEQEAIFMWAEIQTNKHPELDLLFAIPNGGSRHKLEAYNMKKQGVKSGVPDMCLPVGRGDYISLYIEMKVKPNKPSTNQKMWIEKLRKYGNKVEVCYSFEEAKNEILKYLGIVTNKENSGIIKSINKNLLVYQDQTKKLNTITFSDFITGDVKINIKLDEI